MLSYKYFWNTGLYMWKVGTILEKFKTHAPAIFKTAQNEKRMDKPKISIDYAIMEKSHLPPYMLCRRILAGMILAIEYFV